MSWVMANTTARAALVLSPEEQQHLQSLAASRTASLREVQRAKLLLGYHAGQSFSALSRTLRLSRRIIYKHVDRALAAGVAVALRDHPHGSDPTLTPEAKAWVLSVACTKPKDHGLAAERWTRSALAQHIRRTARAAGHPSVATAAQSTIHVILRDAPVRPHKIKYYLERRDPDFERKMKEVLIVSREVRQLAESPALPGTPRTGSVSVDEKPGVQALAPTAPDLPPVPGTHPGSGPRLRIYPAGHGLDSGGVGPARWPRDRAGGTAPSQRGVHWLAARPRRLVSDRGDDSLDPGQSLRPYQQGDDGLSGPPAQSLRLGAYAQARFMAQPGRDALRQDGADVSARDAGGPLAGTEGAHSARRRGNQPGTRGASLEQLYRLGDSAMTVYLS